MKGWFDPAKISCSAMARLTLFRLIISRLLNTFIANNLSVFFSFTRYTLPTSPLPSSLILLNDDGPTSTCRTRIDDDEYVRRKPCLGDPAKPLPLLRDPVDNAGEGGASDEAG